MFTKETEMAPGVTRWLKSLGLEVRREFVTPWGLCDLVGLRLNADRVAYRLSLKQTRPVSSITRAAILLKLPEHEGVPPTTLDRLISDFRSVVDCDVVECEINQLIADRYVVRTKLGGLQKVNGWLPLEERLIAVEMKLSKVDEAFRQAKANLGFSSESLVAFPIAIARKIEATRHRWKQYLDAGIGVLGVKSRSCELLVPSMPPREVADPAVRMYCVEKFWRNHLPI